MWHRITERSMRSTPPPVPLHGRQRSDAFPCRRPRFREALCMSAQWKALAFDAKTGAVKWRARAGSGTSTPAVVGGVVYETQVGEALRAFDAETGAVLWRTRAPLVSSPALCERQGLCSLCKHLDRLRRLRRSMRTTGKTPLAFAVRWIFPVRPRGWRRCRVCRFFRWQPLCL